MQGDPHHSIIDRVREMTPGAFEQEVESLWQAGYKVVETITELVKDESISPLQGLGLIGCTTSQLFAYSAFHGEATSVDLASALLPAAGRTSLRS